MILILRDQADSMRVGHVPPDVALALIGQLPASSAIRIEPDEPEDHTVKPAGYFGLAVALAHQTWKG